MSDLIEHEATMDCPCKPGVVDGVVVHNALDGRVVFEQARETLNNTN